MFLRKIAAIYDGVIRSVAARVGRDTVQVARDWVATFSTGGPNGLLGTDYGSLYLMCPPKKARPLLRTALVQYRIDGSVSGRGGSTRRTGHPRHCPVRPSWVAYLHASDDANNIALMSSLVKCAELNGQINVLGFLRDKWLSNHIFASYGNVGHCCNPCSRVLSASSLERRLWIQYVITFDKSYLLNQR